MTRLNIPDMSCGHCKAAVETAIAAVDRTARVTVDLPSRVVEIDSTASMPALLAALEGAGYPATVAG